jgi:hypothetical protein
VRSIFEGPQASSFVTSEPGVDALATDAVLLGHLADTEAVPDDGDYRVITLFHLRALHKHSATSLPLPPAETGGSEVSSNTRHCVKDHPELKCPGSPESIHSDSWG